MVLIKRSTGEILSLNTLITAAEQIAHSKYKDIAFNEMINLIKKDPVTTLLLKDDQTSSQDENSRVVKISEKGFTNSEDVIDYLIENNFLSVRRRDGLAFANPAIFAFLLAHSKTYSPNVDWKYLLHSPVDSIILRYSQNQNQCIPGWISDNDPYLHRNLMLAGKQMRKCKQDRVYFSTLARRLLPVILDDNVPLSTRLSLSAFFDIDSQSYAQFLERLINQPSRNVRQLVALNLGRLKKLS